MKTKGLIKLKNPELIPFRFTDRAEAESSARFFFGVEMVAKIKEDIRGLIFSECTGIGWKKNGEVMLNVEILK